MNLVIDLKGYDGENTNTCQANFRRNAQYVGINLTDEVVQEITIPGGGASVTLFDKPSDPRKFIYLETSGECAIQINDIDESTVKPVVVGDTTQKGVYLKSSDIEKVIIGNDNADAIKIYYITSK